MGIHALLTADGRPKYVVPPLRLKILTSDHALGIGPLYLEQRPAPSNLELLAAWIQASLFKKHLTMRHEFSKRFGWQGLQC